MATSVRARTILAGCLSAGRFFPSESYRKTLMMSLMRMLISAAGWLKIDIRVSKDIYLAREFISDIFYIRIGTKSRRTLLIIAGETSDPQIGGARLVPNIFSPS